MVRPLVIVFARAPRYGAVKTRLARDIGAAETLRFYRGALGGLIWRLSRDARWDVALCVTPDAASRESGLWPSGVARSTQGTGDLGRRMIRALRGAGNRPAVVIGSDIPDIGPQHVAAALKALGAAPFVFGPARDGGYWLIGARHPARLRKTVLDGVRWSNVSTLDDSLQRLAGAKVLPIVLDDIDDGAAFDAFRARSRA